MWKRLMSTHAGDVLILWTAGAFTTYAVGRVVKDGQQDFRGPSPVQHFKTSAEAASAAKAIVAFGHRIFSQSVDTGDWSKIQVAALGTTR